MVAEFGENWRLKEELAQETQEDHGFKVDLPADFREDVCFQELVAEKLREPVVEQVKETLREEMLHDLKQELQTELREEMRDRLKYEWGQEWKEDLKEESEGGTKAYDRSRDL